MSKTPEAILAAIAAAGGLWNPSKGNTKMSLEEFAARHPNLTDQRELERRWAASQSSNGIITKNGDSWAPADPTQGGEQTDYKTGADFQEANPEWQAMNPELPEVLRKEVIKKTIKSKVDRKDQPQMNYKEFLAKHGNADSTALMGAKFRQSQGLELNDKMKEALMAAAQRKWEGAPKMKAGRFEDGHGRIQKTITHTTDNQPWNEILTKNPDGSITSNISGGERNPDPKKLVRHSVPKAPAVGTRLNPGSVPAKKKRG